MLVVIWNCIGKFLPTFRGILSDSWLLKIGPIGCPETSIRNYHHSLRNYPEERSCQSHAGTTVIELSAVVVWHKESCSGSWYKLKHAAIPDTRLSQAIAPNTEYVLLHNTRNVDLLWLCLKVDHSFIFRARKKKVKGILLKGNNLEAFKFASLKLKHISYKTIHHFANLCSLLFYTVSFYQQKLLSNG